MIVDSQHYLYGQKSLGELKIGEIILFSKELKILTEIF